MFEILPHSSKIWEIENETDFDLVLLFEPDL